MQGQCFSFKVKLFVVKTQYQSSYRYFLHKHRRLHKLSVVEKLKIIEALWRDLVDGEDNLSSPSWHETELIKTENKFLSGDIEVLNWQQAKKELRSQFE